MRIERIEIDGFGRFSDAAWTLSDGLTVLVGANEAGKTTLLNALRALLFGFEPTRDGRAWYPALAGGRRGGRLALRTAAGERWTVERHGERGGAGSVAVRAPNGNQGGQETLDRLLRGADRDLYNNIFAFGLGELQTFSSLNADGVRGRIYGAGAGLGGTSALDLERRLRQQIDGIFLPRGSQKPLNQLLARIDELGREIADLSDQPEQHAALHRERGELVALADELRGRIRDAREELARLNRTREAVPIAAELTLVEEELHTGDAALDRLPADAVEILDRLAAELRDARTRLGGLDEQLAEARSARSRVDVDARVTANAEAVAALVEERSMRLGAVVQRTELESAAARSGAGVDEQLARAGGWAEERLVALDDSIPSVEATRSHEGDLATARAAAAEAEAARRSAAEELRLREREDVAGVDPNAATLEDRSAALRAFDELRIRRAAAGAGDPWPAVGLPAAVGAAAGAVLGAAGGAFLGAPLPGALVGAAVALVLILVAGRPARRSGHETLDAERRVLMERLGLPADASDDDVAGVAEGVAAARARRDLGRDHEAALKVRRAELERRTRVAEERAAAANDAEQRWLAWLRERGLPADATPEAARQLLVAAGIARRAANERDEIRRRLGEMAAADAEFAERADDLLRSLGEQPDGDASRRLALVAELGRRLEEARLAERRAGELEATIAQLSEKRVPAAAAVVDAERALAAHLAALGSPEPDALRRRATEAAKRRAVQARARELRASLAGIAGGPAAVAALIAECGAADAARIDALAVEGSETIARLEQDERAAINRIGALEAELRRLEAAEELGAKRQELAALQGQAASLARDWSVRALALHLLEETRSRYERERQPDVVRAAETHFERITAGRYARIVAPPGDSTVRVETEGGQARGTDELSRGTAEQLYLALRFGLIEQFAKHAEPLPVVMDDILVNFDADRAGRAAAAIGDLAQRHQVLYFTCHAGAAELLDPGAERTLTLE